MTMQSILEKCVTGKSKKSAIKKVVEQYPCVKYLEPGEIPIEVLVKLEFQIQALIESINYVKLNVDKFIKGGK